MQRKKEQDEQELLDDKAHEYKKAKDDDDIIHAYTKNEEETIVLAGRKKKKKFRNQRDVNEEDDIGRGEPGAKGDSSVLTDPSLSHGIADILVQTTVEGAEAEMSKQDVDKVDKVTRELRKEKDDAFLKQIKMQLKKMKIPDQTMNDIIDSVMEDLRNKAKMLQDEKTEVEEEVRKQHKNKKSGTGEMENEIDKLDAQLEQKLGRLHEDERDYIRGELAKRTDLTEEQIEALMSSLLKEMSNLEKKLGLEFNRQNRNLEERLAKRRQIMEFRKLQDAQEKQDIKDRVEVMEAATQELVDKDSIKQQQRDQILNEYMLDLQRITVQHDKNAQQQLENLAEKLRQRRIKRMSQLHNKHEQDKKMFIAKNERSTDTADFLQHYHDVQQQQRAELEMTETDIDQAELQQIDNLKQKLMLDKSHQVENRTDQVRKQLEDAWVDPKKAEWIIELHRAQMEKLNDSRLTERKRMANKLREMWEQKMAQLDNEEEKQKLEEETLIEQQTSTVSRVLTSSVELTEEAKRKIMKEHEHNMNVLNNQLEKSKTRQQKNIEYRLNQRRARNAQLRKEKEEAMIAKTKASKAEQEKLARQFEEEIAAQERQIEEERQAALMALRRRMAAETEEALNQQEQQLGQLLGRLEVGSARRQAVLEKQDTMLQNLQDQLEKKLSKGGVQMTGADQIIMQHYNQVEHLNNQLQSSRENQEYIIKEKLQAKKLQKESELQEQMQEEKQVVKNSSIRRRGARKASDILSQVFMKQRHARQMEELEQEMKLELERSKEELNRQLEKELESELNLQKKQLLTELAHNSNLTERDLMTAVNATVSETGGDQRHAKKLAKDLRQGLQKAKTMDMSDDDEPLRPSSRTMRRPGSGTSDTSRPKSGLGKKKHPKRSSVSPLENTWAVAEDEEDF